MGIRGVDMIKIAAEVVYTNSRKKAEMNWCGMNEPRAEDRTHGKWWASVVEAIP